MKGIILVGGKGSRLYPITLATHKQLVPVYDKPMIYYPIATLMDAGIRDILIISTKEYEENYKKLLGDGSSAGIHLSYVHEEKSEGTAKAIILGKDFVGEDDFCLLFGDNLFLGNMETQTKWAIKNAQENHRATIFALEVSDPQRFGVAEFDKDGKVLSLEEKPVKPKSNYAVTGLYFYTHQAVKYAQELKPSARGEYEITDINNRFLDAGNLDIQIIPNEVKWLDVGKIEPLFEASEFVRDALYNRNVSLGNIFLSGYRNGWINKNKLIAIGNNLHSSEFGQYLLKVAKEPNKGVGSRYKEGSLNHELFDNVG